MTKAEQTWAERKRKDMYSPTASMKQHAVDFITWVEQNGYRREPLTDTWFKPCDIIDFRHYTHEELYDKFNGKG